MSIQKNAPGAGQGVEGVNQKPAQPPVDTKATRKARAAVARPGTIAADHRITIQDTPDPDSYVRGADEIRSRTARRDVRFAENDLAHLPLQLRRTTKGRRVRVWRSADGRWWRQGGTAQIKRLEDGTRSFVVTLYKGANEGDVKFLLKMVAWARRGQGFGDCWRPFNADRADDVTFATGSLSRPYADPYTHSDQAADVVICDDPNCGKLWHGDWEVHELDQMSNGVATGTSWEIRVIRLLDKNEPWKVTVHVDDFYGAPDDVAAFVSDLQWMQAECERANKERAV